MTNAERARLGAERNAPLKRSGCVNSGGGGGARQQEAGRSEKKERKKKTKKKERKEHGPHAAPPRAAKNKRGRLTRCRALIEMPPGAAQILPSGPQHESLADYADERTGALYGAAVDAADPFYYHRAKDPFETNAEVT